MNDTFFNTLLQYSEKEPDHDRTPPPRPSSVLFSRPPSSMLVSRPPSAAYFPRSSTLTKRPKRPPSTSTLRHRPSSRNELYQRPPSVSTIATVPRPTSAMAVKKGSSLKCNICSEGYHFPGSVPCYDNFCTNCLEEHILTYKRGTACDCPLCKTGILLPKSSFNPKQPGGRIDSELHVCNTCGGSRLAQYRCNKCEEFFCEKCNKDFLKRMRIDSNFNVTNIEDMSIDNLGRTASPGGNDYESLDSVELPAILPPGFGLRCSDHEEEELRYHCVDCNVAICRDCKILSHEGHETKSLEDVYEERKSHLNQTIKLSNSNIRKLHGECSEINSKRLEIDQESRDAVSVIENHANEVKKMIDELSKSMIKSIRVHNTESRGTLEKCRDTVKEKVRVLQDLVEKATKLVESENGIDIVKEGPEYVNQLNDADVSLTADKLWRKKLVFEEQPVTEESTAKAFGKLLTVIEGLTKENPTVDLEIQSAFNTDQKFKNTTSVAPLSDNTVWVCNGYKNRIQKFDVDGTRLQTEVLDFDVDDMVVGKEEKLYFTEVNGKVIRLFRNKKLTVFARSDVYLRGITLSRDSTNVVACGNDVPVACLREAVKCKVVTFNLQGKLIKEILVETGSIGINLFRISHTINDEYVVSTGVSGYYFIIGGETGHTKYRYKVSGTADGVACDKHGLIYLSSCRDDTLYLLNCKGVPIPTTYAMHRPTAVSIDNNDVIWVGDWSKVHVMLVK